MAKFYRSEDRTVLFELFGAGTSVENLKNLKANTTDAAVEKHVPVYTIEGSHVHVVVGETKHPMLEEHFIEWITLNTNQGIYRKQLNPGQEPVADFCLCDGEQVEEVYAYCNLHGLWRNNE